MKALILLIILVLSMNVGCGRIDVVHTVETDNLVGLFQATCKAQHPTYSFSQTEACAQAALGEFLNALSKGN
jgi:hypothetical protein